MIGAFLECSWAGYNTATYLSAIELSRCYMPFLIVVYISGLIALLCVCGLSGYWILQPIAKAVKGRRRPTRYSMIDVLWLSIMATVSLAPVANFFSAQELPGLNWAICFVTMMSLAVVVIVWWRGIATLSGLRIVDHRRRGTFLLVLLPLSLTVSLVGVPGLLALFGDALNGTWFELLFWFLAVASFILVVLVARQMSLWVLSGAVDADGVPIDNQVSRNGPETRREPNGS